ncbi:dTDP-4-dehydrorhamnose 3,5-epimerase-like enzyme [Pseudorhizobium tarimense]|uniref:dTDP-4-dehydrorhamnose 3,5-epimerase-like enzyme n=1 Tax=Pseudorhizobium tarimense TaxID=1079109 RepID=A0ABV2H5Q5_9HYPH|nr:FdtA/QdtA family cupin domain-containing protein [Pseudorhizobium tarimense]MCJ8519278.1 FdtA/QdtA family cupin domain-containing protein [Pseudorhizobium tarimense]
MSAERPKERLILLPTISDSRGILGFAQEGDHVPFAIKRMYYMYSIPTGATRGAHAHRACQRLLIALNGSVKVTIDDGHRRDLIKLTSPSAGLHIPAGLWIDLDDFSEGTILAALASHPYEESDYLRDYEAFLAYANENFQ